ncbi:MAG: hypothetical protein J7518_11685 [Nocardioidaceae bacterium]|nr:hypothetical protein [Nocardioidaceae bacterium]
MKKPVLAALSVLLLLALTACGGSSKDKPKLDKEEKKVAKNIAQTFAQQSSGALTPKESSCFAQSFVDKVGLPELKKKKLITEKGELNQTGATFDKATSAKFADAFLGCVDYQKRQAEQIAKADKTVDAKKLEDCLREDLPTSFVKKLIVASQTQSSDSTKLVDESTKKVTACKTKATKKK